MQTKISLQFCYSIFNEDFFNLEMLLSKLKDGHVHLIYLAGYVFRIQSLKN